MPASSVTYTGDGATSNRALTFGYLSKDDVFVSLDGVDDPTFTWNTDAEVTITPAPANPVSIVIYRVTPRTTPVATLADGQVDLAVNYNNIALQTLYSLQEIEDTYTTVGDAVASAAAAAVSAAAALVSENAAAADEALTDADATATAADVVATNADVVLTTADAAATALDAIATAADAIATAADVVLTNADVVTTNADVVLTTADAAATALDAIATAADLVATDADVTATAASASAASTSESNASTSASNASTSESNASTSASNASTSATNAGTSATNASNSASAASTSETNAGTSETNAAASEAAAALEVANLTGTSTTSLAIAVASKVFTTQASKSFSAGTWLLATSDADPTNYMHGQVTSYSGTTLTVNVTNIGGSGTLADWTIRVAGTQGATGDTGATGPAGTGDVVGPASVTDDLPAIFDGTTGKLIKQKTYAAFKTLLSLVAGDVGLGNVDNTSNATERAASATLSSKTLVDPVITGTINEDAYTISDGAGFAIDPGNGSIQKITLGANRTPTASGWTEGDTVTLLIADGTAYTITWSTIGVVWKDATAPTLATTGYTEVSITYQGSVYRGVTVGDFAS